jgi:chromosome segregation ATPase
MMGMVVIILLQLSQFVFAWKKDMRQNDAVRKEDLTALRQELKDEINQVSGKVDKLKQSVDARIESARAEQERHAAEAHNRITSTALQTAALMEGMEHLKQSVLSLGAKIDHLRQPRTPR